MAIGYDVAGSGNVRSVSNSSSSVISDVNYAMAAETMAVLRDRRLQATKSAASTCRNASK